MTISGLIGPATAALAARAPHPHWCTSSTRRSTAGVYDAFHLDLRYNCLRKDLTIRVTITADTASAITPAVETTITRRHNAKEPGSGADAPNPGEEVWDVVSAPPGARTPKRAAQVRSAQVRVPGMTRTCASGVDLGADPMAPPALVDWAVLVGAAACLGIDLADASEIQDLVAVAIARLAWRDGPVENWHRVCRISNSEMMRANAATTRLLRDVLATARVGVGAGDAVGQVGEMFGAVARVLADPQRRLPDGRTLAELAGDAVQLGAFQRNVRMFCTRWNTVADRYGASETMALLAIYAGRWCWRWWLAPGWLNVVDEYIRRLDDPTRWVEPAMTWHVATAGAPDLGGVVLRARLLVGPDQLTAADAAQCFWTGLGGLRPLDCGQPPLPRHVLPPGYLNLVIAPMPFAD